MTAHDPSNPPESPAPKAGAPAPGASASDASLELKLQLLRLERLFRHSPNGSADQHLRQAVVNYRSGLSP